MRRGCKEPIPSSTQDILATQKRNWAIDQALQYCKDGEHVPLSWHNRLKNATPCYDKAVDFLQKAETTSSPLASDNAAYIDIDSIRPHIVGFANLLISMRDAEAHLLDLDADPTDLLRKRKWRYTVMAMDHYLENQAKQRKRCTTSMLREYLQPGANQILDEIWGLIENFPPRIISPIDDEDVRLLFDFVVQLCKEKAATRSLKTRSKAVVAKVMSQLKSLEAE